MKNQVALSSVVFAMALGACGTGGEPEVMSFEEFKAQATREVETGHYIVDGDMVVDSEEGMRAIYESFLDSVDAVDGDGLSTTDQSLIVNRVGSRDDKWSASAARNITYCVSRTSFGSRYNTVVAAMNSATAAWEATSNTNFVHNTAQDNNCTASNSAVVFDVRQVCSGQYLARAFFPSNGRSSRNVLIDCSSFGGISPYTLTGILRHELGHTLGFRHEHTRPEAGTCFENNAWRALTTYDSASVMHYPQCNGSNNGDLVLTSRDRSGARALYP